MSMTPEQLRAYRRLRERVLVFDALNREIRATREAIEAFTKSVRTAEEKKA